MLLYTGIEEIPIPLFQLFSSLPLALMVVLVMVVVVVAEVVEVVEGKGERLVLLSRMGRWSCKRRA